MFDWFVCIYNPVCCTVFIMLWLLHQADFTYMGPKSVWFIENNYAFFWFIVHKCAHCHLIWISYSVSSSFVCVVFPPAMRNASKPWCWGRNSFLWWRRWRTLLLSWPKQLMVTFFFRWDGLSVSLVLTAWRHSENIDMRTQHTRQQPDLRLVFRLSLPPSLHSHELNNETNTEKFSTKPFFSICDFENLRSILYFEWHCHQSQHGLFHTVQLPFDVYVKVLCPHLFFLCPLRAAGLWWPPLCHPAGLKSWELHERCWYFSVRIIRLLLIHLSSPLVLSLYWNHVLFRVVTMPTSWASGWRRCSSWQTPRPTSLAWTSCTTLPRWGEVLGWTAALWGKIFAKLLCHHAMSCWLSLPPTASRGHWPWVADLSHPTWTHWGGSKVAILIHYSLYWHCIWQFNWTCFAF